MNAVPVVLALAVVAIVLAVTYRPVLATGLFALLAPIGLMTVLGNLPLGSVPGNMPLITATAILLILLAVAQRLLAGRGAFPVDLATVSAVVWSIGVVASVVRSDDWGRSIVFGTWQIVAVLLPLAWRQLVGLAGRIEAVLRFWLVGAAAVAASGLVLASTGFDEAFGGAVVTGRPVGVFSQPNEYGNYCMVVGMVAVTVAVLARGWTRLLAIVTATSALAGMVLSLSRGAWLGELAGLLLLAVLVPQARRPLAWASLTAVMLVGLVVAVSPGSALVTVVAQRAASIADPASNPYDRRPVLVAEGLREWQSSPALGIGPNMFQPTSTTIGSAAFPDGGEHPHNFVVAVLAEQGVVGLAALVGFFVVAIRAVGLARLRLLGPRHGRAPPVAPFAATVVLAAAVGLGAFAVEGLFDYPLRNALSRTSVWLVFGWLLAGQRALQEDLSSRIGDTSPQPTSVLGNISSEPTA